MARQGRPARVRADRRRPRVLSAGARRPKVLNARVLTVAYYFPPVGGIGSIRAARFATYLPELGWEPTVLAPDRTAQATDPGLSFPEERVVRARSIDLSLVGRAMLGARDKQIPAKTAGGGGGDGGLRTTLRSTAHRYLYYPDGHVGWYPGAVRAGARLLRRERFDVIYSSSSPVTGHLIARTLSRRSNLPWVAEFRDPWSDRFPADHPHRRRSMKLEAALGREATKVIVPTPTLAELWEARWGREVELIPNGHDLNGPLGEPPAQPTLTHVGTYYPGKQNFRGLWAAIQELARAGDVAPPRIRFVGELADEVRDEVEAAGLSSLLEATGFIPHADAMQAMGSSTVLFASGFAGKDPISRGVIPAKLFEYLASRLPILYLGDRDDDAGMTLRDQPGCFVLDPHDVTGIAAALRTALAGGPYERDVEAFSRRARTKALAQVLDAAAGRSRD